MSIQRRFAFALGTISTLALGGASIAQATPVASLASGIAAAATPNPTPQVERAYYHHYWHRHYWHRHYWRHYRHHWHHHWHG